MIKTSKMQYISRKIFKANNIKSLKSKNIYCFYFSYYLKKDFKLDETMKSVTLKYGANKNDEENQLKILNEDNQLTQPLEINKNLSRMENLMILKQKLQIENKKTEEETNHKMRIKFSMFLLFIGAFSLWVPLYRSICESQGFSIKTNHVDYKFDGRKRKIFYFIINSQCNEEIYRQIYR